MSTLLQDVRYALRTLRRDPGFTVIAVLALALGIGANAAIFSVADAFLLKPIPGINSDRLVGIVQLGPGQDDDGTGVSAANFLDWREQSRAFERLAATEWYEVNITGGGLPEHVRGFLATANFFESLEARAFLGRTFLPEEEHPGRDDVVVLSYPLWERRFASDPGIVGKTLKLEGQDRTVIGVMPKGFDYPVSARLWLPLAMTPAQRSIRSGHFLNVIARRKQGVSLREARAEMEAINRRLQESYPDTNRGWNVRIAPIQEMINGRLTQQYTILLLVAVGFVLLIACANVANLQLARAASRQKELAVRRALGASRWRIIRQLLTESVLLSLAGALAGMLFAQWGVDLILSNMPPDVARFIGNWNEIRLDVRSFLFALAVAVVAGIVSGLAPAWHSSRANLNETLKEGGRGFSAGRARHLLRNIFVIAEVAAALVLLIGSGLMVKGVYALLGVHQSADPDAILTFQVNLPDARYKDAPARVAFYDQALRQLESLPGVETAAVSSSLPFSSRRSNGPFSIEGRPAADHAAERLAYFQIVSPSFFRQFRIPLRQGRLFSAQDTAESERVAVISEDLARRYFPGEVPIGRRIRVGLDSAQNPWHTIVGIVGDVKFSWQDRGPQPALYRPVQQAPRGFAFFSLRTSAEPAALAPALRARVAAVDPEMPVFEIKTHARVIHESILGLSYVASLLGVAGAIALLLSALGVYGVMAYSVAERTHEIGIRMALGAQQRDVLRLVLGRGLLLIGIGVAIGLPASIALARVIASLIFGTSAMDLATFGGVSFSLALVALLACWIPARRASRVDPMVALRYE